MPNMPTIDPQMKTPLTISMVFHAVILILAITGLPYLKSDPPLITSVPVELISAEDASKPPPPAEHPREPQQVDKPPEKVPEKPREPQNTAKELPKPVAPQKPDVSELAPPEEKKPEKVKKPEKPVTAPKPVKRPVLTQEETQEEQEEFKSLLRNLMPEEPTPAASDEKAAETSPLSRFSQQMSMSELAGLQAQLSQCWKLMSGARYAEDLIVEIKLFMNPDRTVRDAQLIDNMRYMSDNYYRAAADSAMRAVRDPHCNPLELPPNKYDMWKEITVVFDPREML